MPEVNGIQVPFLPRTASTAPKPSRAPKELSSPEPFAKVLQHAQEQLRFSAHALERLRSRALYPSPVEFQSLIKGIELAATKGARNALIVIGRKAFVVSVENRTVITALDQQQLTERIVTNIDAAVFFDK